MYTLERFFSSPTQSFFLFGPRGTGKSTWLRQHYPNALYINLLEPDILREYSAKPERLIAIINANSTNKTIIIDEIQKEPLLLPVVHSLIEEHRGLQFILTGSSARKLKKEGVDLLAGRALNKSLHPFMAAEMGDLFNMETALFTGMIPIIASAENPAEVLKTYISLYLREEVKLEGLVRNFGAFSRFLEAASLSHSQVLNISNVARDCQVGRKTVEGFFSILEDLLIAFQIPVFTKRAQRTTIAHPKFFFFDSGAFRSIRPKGPLDSPEDITGASLEGLVAQHLRAWIDYSGNDAVLYYWRTKSETEVDFIVYGESCFYALEVKANTRARSEYLRGLHSFKSDYPECTPVLLYMGKERLMIDGILCLPCEDFLKELMPGGKLLNY